MVRLFVTALLMAASAMAQQHKISVRKYEPPKYPPIARVAHIQGDVKLRFEILPNGEVQGIQVVSGHPMLQIAAVSNIKSWRFHCDDCKIDESASHIFVYRFTIGTVNTEIGRLSKGPDDYTYVCYDFPDAVQLFVEPPAENIIGDPIGRPVHSRLWLLFHPRHWFR